MLKVHCDVCDSIIEDSDPRVRFKKYPHAIQNIPAGASFDVTICEKCLSHYTLLDIVAKFERKRF